MFIRRIRESQRIRWLFFIFCFSTFIFIIVVLIILIIIFLFTLSLFWFLIIFILFSCLDCSLPLKSTTRLYYKCFISLFNSVSNPTLLIFLKFSFFKVSVNGQSNRRMGPSPLPSGSTSLVDNLLLRSLGIIIVSLVSWFHIIWLSFIRLSSSFFHSILSHFLKFFD